MTKTLVTYSGFAIACLVVIAAFITAKTYIQLAFASLLYPLLIFFAYKVLPLKTMQVPKKPEEKVEADKKNSIEISDIDKRAFLKLIGATGLSFFLISIFGRRAEALLFGQHLAQTPSAGTPPGGKPAAPAVSPTENYKISEIDESIVSYFGFINKDGGWFIMKEDANTGSFRYIKGGSNFPGNWDNREYLKYDYSHNVFI